MSGGPAIRMSDYDYPLPADRIAQAPVSPRDASRLLVLDRGGGNLRHLRFRDLPSLLRPGDLLVVNDTRVRPARIRGRRPGGGTAEFLFLREESAGTWVVMCDATRKLRPEMPIDFGDGAVARVASRDGEQVTLRFEAGADAAALLERWGEVPLPPYIHREAGESAAIDRERYQTVYAKSSGAVAAPTAGLHFTDPLLDRVREAGAGVASVTLHVGPGTFLPVRTEDAREHRIQSEAFEVSEPAAEYVRRTRDAGGRVLAVGTTSARVLEHLAGTGGVRAAAGECDLYVLPGFRFQAVDGLLTNFHLPRSTLLLFVAAFAGRDRILSAYREAVTAGYRFYSYGDAMLIL